MNINRSKQLQSGQFYPVNIQKTSIFLHHTVGLNPDGAINWWNQTPEKVGTAYVIGRDGTIYETFPPEYYAFHLGIQDPTFYHDIHGIGIEIVSAGPVVPLGEDFMFYPLYPKTIGAQKIPKEEVIAFDDPWRGNKYYHKYSPEQIQAVKELIQYLLEKFPTIKVQETLMGFMNYNEDVWKKKLPGIWSHSTVRKDKSDIIPQPEFLEMLWSFFPEEVKNPKPTPSEEAKKPSSGKNLKK